MRPRGRGLRLPAITALLAPGILAAVAALPACSREKAPEIAAKESAPAAEEEPDLDRLASLPYLSTVPSDPARRGESGVVVHDAGKAWEGVNLFTPRPEPEARLISMDGELLHTWRSEAGQPAPGAAVILDFLAGWHHVEPLGDGRILAIVENRMILALDAGSRVLWTAEVPAHHDIAVAEPGEIYTLCARRVRDESTAGAYPILDEEITILSGSGKVERSISILDLLRRDERTKQVVEEFIRARMTAYATDRMERFHAGFRRSHAAEGEAAIREHLERLDEVLAGTFAGDEVLALGTLRNTPSDVIHANSIEILGHHPAGLWNRGDLLVSLRNLSIIAVVDMSGPRLSWIWGPGEIDRQHQPSALPNGHVLVFDNGVAERRSRVLEVDPAGGKIVWTYEGTPKGSFFSPIRGGAEGLPNGDVLVTDSEQGKIFELTRGGEIVWEYLSPEKETPPGARVAIYRMTRLRREQVLGDGGS